MTFRDRRHRLAMLCAVIMALIYIVSLSPAQAQQPAPHELGQEQPAPLELPPLPNQPPPGEKFGDWVKRCEQPPNSQEQRCFISQILVLSQNNQRRNVLFIAIGYYGANKVPGAILRVPLGLVPYLPAGLLLEVPGAKPIRIIFENCLPSGCNAATKLEPDMISAMQKASRGSVEVVNMRRQKLALPLSFKGFTAGFASLGKG